MSVQSPYGFVLGAALGAKHHFTVAEDNGVPFAVIPVNEDIGLTFRNAPAGLGGAMVL